MSRIRRRNLEKSLRPGTRILPPVMIEHGGKRQLILFLADSLNSLDPDTGKKFWSLEMKPSYGMAIMLPRLHGDHLFAAAIDNVSLMAKLDSRQPAAKVDWRGDLKQGIYPVCPCPSSRLTGPCTESIDEEN